MTLVFPNTEVRALDGWKNYSGTISRPVATYCEIQAGHHDGQMLQRHAQAVREILRHCFTNQLPVRTVGSTWSFSKVIQPESVIIDPGNLSHLARVPQEHFTPSYKTRAAQGLTPVFVEGGTGIGTLNRALGTANPPLALQTSGAGDGHRIGGCIATGTHGSALGVGALHDTVLAMYVIVGPDQALFVQRGSDPPFLPSAATWLEEQTGTPTRAIADDAALAAVQVSLGSLGFVLGVIVEAEPLYRLQIRRVKKRLNDDAVRNAIHTLDTHALHADVPEAPFHFDVVMHPYPVSDKATWFATMMWKRDAAGVPFASPLQGIPRTASDTIGLIGALAQRLSGPFTGPLELALISGQILSQLESDAARTDDTLFPGQVFGPTTLPPGRGASTEIVLDHELALPALDAVYEALREQAFQHRYLLGCVALRFVPKTRALLGMNQFDMNCYIELPSIYNEDVIAVYHAVWDKLEAKGIPFTCHWGQLNCFTPARVARYFGANADTWKQQRRQLLGDEVAMKVFASAILRDAGLDG